MKSQKIKWIGLVFINDNSDRWASGSGKNTIAKLIAKI